MDPKSFLKLLVETESPSHSKSAVDRVGLIVAEEAHKLGAQIEVIPNQETGDHVIAHFAPANRQVKIKKQFSYCAIWTRSSHLAQLMRRLFAKLMERSLASAHWI